jgi:hypothetical protein
VIVRDDLTPRSLTRSCKGSPCRIRRHLLWSIACCLIVLGFPALADGISGTYVGKADNGAVLVQLVQTDDRRLTGRYEQVVLKPDGKLDDVNATITGATDGKTVAVTITPNEFLAGSFVASGTIQGRVLHLSGGGHGSNLAFDLINSEEVEFRTQVAILTNRANEIRETRERQEATQRQAKLEADQLAYLKNLTRRMAAFTSKADVELAKFTPAEQRYRTITKRMRAALVREQSIHGGGQASVTRSQISIDVNQAAINADQFHTGVQFAYQHFDTNSSSLLRDQRFSMRTSRILK